MNNSTSNTKDNGLWDIIKPVKGQIYIAMFLSVLNVIASLASLIVIPFIARELFADVINSQYIWQLIGLSGIAVIIAFVSRVWAFRISHMAAFELEEILRTQISEHLARLPLGYVITLGSGAIKKIVQDDVKELHGFVADSTPLYARAYTAPLLTLIILFIVDWRMALATIVLVPITIVAIKLAMRDYSEKREAYDLANEKINGTIVEFVQGMQVVRTFDDGTTSFIRFRNILDEFTRYLKEWAQATNTAGRIGFLVTATLPTLVIVVSVGAWLMVQGKLDFTTLLVFLLLSSGVAESIMPILWLSSFINKANAAAQRIYNILAVAVLPQTENPQQPTDTSISFQDVTFSYNDGGNPALSEINCYMAPGTVTALIGTSGAGKSTVAKLIPRFWDVDSGVIKIGGVDVREMTSETLMNYVSFVFQDTFLLYDTIKDNIRLGRPNATDAEVEAAAKAARAHDFILELPQGYDTIAGSRGTRLSGGQRQRITIARAILQDNPIVILDEATAFTDPENEALIQEAIAKLTVGKTLIVIAHRLSTIVDADQIIVLDKGKIVERGKHEQLATANGIYASLWNNYQLAQNWGIRNHTVSG
ncbi:MAG: ABC transporter ATP-binding protein [Cyanobacteria bacterium P01_D01_bin.116]